MSIGKMKPWMGMDVLIESAANSEYQNDSRGILSQITTPVTMFVKPPHFYGVEFSIYTYVYKTE